MEKKDNYRKANGRRSEGRGLAVRIAREVTGMMLAQAFVVTKAAGFQLNINKLDGLTRKAWISELLETVNVDVVDGFVRKSWAT